MQSGGFRSLLQACDHHMELSRPDEGVDRNICSVCNAQSPLLPDSSNLQRNEVTHDWWPNMQ